MTLVQELAKAVIENHITFTQMGDAYCAHCKAENWIEDEFSSQQNVSHSPECVVLKAKQLVGE